METTNEAFAKGSVVDTESESSSFGSINTAAVQSNNQARQSQSAKKLIQFLALGNVARMKHTMLQTKLQYSNRHETFYNQLIV